MSAENVFDSDVIEEIRDEATWQEKVDNATNPVLVEFFVTWCPHCQREAPVLDSVAETIMADGIDVYHANAEVMWTKGAVYGLEETPSFILVDNGQLVAMHEGFLEGDQIIEFAHLADGMNDEVIKSNSEPRTPQAFKQA